MTTGLVTKRCYAAAYEDCDGGAATREHWITEKLLERIKYDGTGLLVEGLSWADGPRAGDTDLVASRVLCERHNNMLGDLDNTIVGLHDAWLGAAEGRTGTTTLKGDLVERWAIKVLVGMVTSGAVRVGGERVKATSPPQGLLDVLFGVHELPPPRGFYFTMHDERDEGLKIKLQRVGDIVVGITIQFLALRFLTWLTDQATPAPAEQLFYRPAGLDFGKLGRLMLDWRLGAGSQAIGIDIGPITPNPPR